MTPNAFVGRATEPGDNDLAAALGPVKSVWDRLIAELASEYQVDVRQWNCYSPKAGWSLRLLRAKRVIVYLSPCSGCFRVSFVLGDRAVQAARQSKLSRSVIQMIEEAKRYPEGTGLRIEIRGSKQIPAIKKLVALKLEN